MNKLEKKCARCGEPFYARGTKSGRCPECRGQPDGRLQGVDEYISSGKGSRLSRGLKLLSKYGRGG